MKSVDFLCKLQPLCDSIIKQLRIWKTAGKCIACILRFYTAACKYD